MCALSAGLPVLAYMRDAAEKIMAHDMAAKLDGGAFPSRRQRNGDVLVEEIVIGAETVELAVGVDFEQVGFVAQHGVVKRTGQELHVLEREKAVPGAD